MRTENHESDVLDRIEVFEIFPVDEEVLLLFAIVNFPVEHPLESRVDEGADLAAHILALYDSIACEGASGFIGS